MVPKFFCIKGYVTTQQAIVVMSVWDTDLDNRIIFTNSPNFRQYIYGARQMFETMRRVHLLNTVVHKRQRIAYYVYHVIHSWCRRDIYTDKSVSLGSTATYVYLHRNPPIGWR